MIAVVGGCSSSDAEFAEFAADIDKVEARAESLETQLVAAEETIRQQVEELAEAQQSLDAGTTRADGWCEEKLAHCEEMLFPRESMEWPESTPAVWSPPHTGYRTAEPTITVVVYAPDSLAMAVNGVTADPESSPYFWVEVPLVEGDNQLVVETDDGELRMLAIRDSSLVRRYGRVLDALAEWDESGTDWFLGIDYGEMDLEPDYGQGDFETGDVTVEFGELLPSTTVIVQSPYSSKEIITGPEAIADYFRYESPPTDVWNVLLDGDTIVHIEGPMLLGD